LDGFIFRCVSSSPGRRPLNYVSDALTTHLYYAASSSEQWRPNEGVEAKHYPCVREPSDRNAFEQGEGVAVARKSRGKAAHPDLKDSKRLYLTPQEQRRGRRDTLRGSFGCTAAGSAI
jgi:hypothetical protein